MKQYRLLQDYNTPDKRIEKGTVITEIVAFHMSTHPELEPEWFEEIKKSECVQVVCRGSSMYVSGGVEFTVYLLDFHESPEELKKIINRALEYKKD